MNRSVKNHSVVKEPEVIFFGGTFDPPHQGHRECIKVAAGRFKGASFVIIPAFAPAGVDGKHKHPLLSFETRRRLCEVAFLDIFKSKKRIIISSVELGLPRPNYTISTLRTLKLKDPAKACGFLMGEDQFSCFAKWREPREILKLVSLVVVSRSYIEERTRKRNSLEDPLQKKVQKVLQSMKIKTIWCEKQKCFLNKKSGQGIFLIEKDLSKAESSRIRSCLSRGKRPPKGWLSKKLEKYLDEVGSDKYHK